MELMILFLFIFAFGSATATFLENDFGTESVWADVYNASWFEFVQLFLGITLVANIFIFKMYKREKLSIFVFHLGFVLILLGSIITRYIGFEAILHIREGKSEDRMITYQPYIQASIIKGDKKYENALPKLMSKIRSNDFTLRVDIDGSAFDIEYKQYIPNATKAIVDDPNGKAMMAMMSVEGSNASPFTLKDGESIESSGLTFALNKQMFPSASVVNITSKDGKFYLLSPVEISWYKMADKSTGTFGANQSFELTSDRLYTLGKTNFAIKDMFAHAVEKIVPASSDNSLVSSKFASGMSALLVNVKYKGNTKEVALMGKGRGVKGIENIFEMDDLNIKLEWGSKVVKLPFKVELVDFKLDRYPGSMSPSSYSSDVVVIDDTNNHKFPFKIFMNHVLDYNGFRFFQSSYDQDELGTVLSVNNDPGKWPTYIGYLLLGIGMFWNLIDPKSRFRKLARKINEDTKRYATASMFIIALLFATNTPAFANDYAIDTQHAKSFGKVLVQSSDGRVKPIDSLSNEVLSKISRKTSLFGQNATQIVLGMMSNPKLWQTQKMIRVNHPRIKEIIGIPKSDRYASFSDFFDYAQQQPYKLFAETETTNRKRPIEKNQFDKELEKVDERLNVAYMVYMGNLFRIFPKIDDPSKKWYAPKEAISYFPPNESENIRSMLGAYFDGLTKGITEQNWQNANKALSTIVAYQQKYGKEIMPSQSQIDAEVFFNKAQIFERLTLVYLLSGMILFISIFIKMTKPKLNITKLTKVIFVVSIGAFVVHTFGLGLRWYVAGHAPWSNAYESMIYIAWATALSGVIFARISALTLSLTSILAGITLFVAHLSWMDPQITTLVPVLKSYWLNIHVSVITASYGFLALCAILGFVSLLFFALKSKNPKNAKQRAFNEVLERNIIESTRINEMSMIFGLFLLTLGNFLGGVWANESWGRYWGWDPKETWALISILVYAIIVHFKYIPKLKSKFTFAAASLVGFYSILMTYFGVNFYLSGMHSYAAGDPVPVPSFVYYITATIGALIVLAYGKRDGVKVS
jgi:cytochrome c-type biogenesis protein CcsB